ncbi:MAG: hypothetical protein U1E31_00375 [Rickettsiales bacterium]
MQEHIDSLDHINPFDIDSLKESLKACYLKGSVKKDSMQKGEISDYLKETHDKNLKSIEQLASEEDIYKYIKELVQEPDTIGKNSYTEEELAQKSIQ